MHNDFLLTNDTAKELYHSYASLIPIIDYHCHINPKEIAENRQYKNLSQLWFENDHYKWRLMRANGVDEYYITGNASDREKFQKYAETLEKAVGNPLFHWSHMELKKYFGYEGILNGKTAEEVWVHCNKFFNQNSINVRNIIESSNVSLICTTDDPTDELIYHDMIKRDNSCKVKVLPAWRPDKVINLENNSFNDYINKLADISRISIKDFDDLTTALLKRMDYFSLMGCKVSDHGLKEIPFVPASKLEIEEIFDKRLNCINLTQQEILKYKTEMLLFFGREYHNRNWVMQLHFGAKRDNNTKMFDILGPDTGYDCIGKNVDLDMLSDFLNELCSTDMLPKTILYSLNPNDNVTINTIIGCFQSGCAKGKLQHGSSWWFNDNKKGIKEQLESLSSIGLLGNFIGMLTDSRSFLSYVRHEYFRRIFCNLVGTWVEDGEYPYDMNSLSELIKNVSYYNSVKYFEFEL